MAATRASDIEFTEPDGFITGGGTVHGPDELIENVFAALANDGKGFPLSQSSASPSYWYRGCVPDCRWTRANW